MLGVLAGKNPAYKREIAVQVWKYAQTDPVTQMEKVRQGFQAEVMPEPGLER